MTQVLPAVSLSFYTKQLITNEQHWLRVEYPDGTLFEMLVELEVSLVAPVPSGEIDYTLSVTPVRNEEGDLIIVTLSGGTSPLDAPAAPPKTKENSGVKGSLALLFASSIAK